MTGEICLICASDEGIFLDFQEQPELKNKARNCNLEKVSEESLSTKVCYKCAFEIEQCNTFVEKIKKANKTRNFKKNSCVLCSDVYNKEVFFDLSKQKVGINDFVQRAQELLSEELKHRELQKQLICLSCRYCVELLTDLQTLSVEVPSKLKKLKNNGISLSNLPKTKTSIINRKTTFIQSSNLDLNTPSDTDSDSSGIMGREKKINKATKTPAIKQQKKCGKCKLFFKDDADIYRIYRTGEILCKQCWLTIDPGKTPSRKRKKVNYPHIKLCSVLLKDLYKMNSDDEKEFEVKKDDKGNTIFVIINNNKNEKKTKRKTSTLKSTRIEDDRTEITKDLQKDEEREKIKNETDNERIQEADKSARSSTKRKNESEQSSQEETESKPTRNRRRKESEQSSQEETESKPTRNRRRKESEQSVQEETESKSTRSRRRKESEQSTQEETEPKSTRSRRRKESEQSTQEETEPKSTRSRRRKESEQSTQEETEPKSTRSRRRKESEQSTQEETEPKSTRSRRRKESEQSIQGESEEKSAKNKQCRASEQNIQESEVNFVKIARKKKGFEQNIPEETEVQSIKNETDSEQNLQVAESTRKSRRRKVSEQTMQEIDVKSDKGVNKKDFEQNLQENEVKNTRGNRRRRESEQSAQEEVEINVDADSDSAPISKKAKKSNSKIESVPKQTLKSKMSDQSKATTASSTRKRNRSTSIESTDSTRKSTRNIKKNNVQELEEIIEIDDDLDISKIQKENVSINEDVMNKSKRSRIDKSVSCDEHSDAESNTSDIKVSSKRSSSISSKESTPLKFKTPTKIDNHENLNPESVKDIKGIKMEKEKSLNSTKLDDIESLKYIEVDTSESEEIDIMKSTDEETKDEALEIENEEKDFSKSLTSEESTSKHEIDIESKSDKDVDEEITVSVDEEKSKNTKEKSASMDDNIEGNESEKSEKNFKLKSPDESIDKDLLEVDLNSIEKDINDKFADQDKNYVNEEEEDVSIFKNENKYENNKCVSSTSNKTKKSDNLKKTKTEKIESQKSSDYIVVYDSSDSELTKPVEEQVQTIYRCTVCDKIYENKLLGLQHELTHMKILKIKLQKIEIPEKVINKSSKDISSEDDISNLNETIKEDKENTILEDEEMETHSINDLQEKDSEEKIIIENEDEEIIDDNEKGVKKFNDESMKTNLSPFKIAEITCNESIVTKINIEENNKGNLIGIEELVEKKTEIDKLNDQIESEHETELNGRRSSKQSRRRKTINDNIELETEDLTAAVISETIEFTEENLKRVKERQNKEFEEKRKPTNDNAEFEEEISAAEISDTDEQSKVVEELLLEQKCEKGSADNIKETNDSIQFEEVIETANELDPSKVIKVAQNESKIEEKQDQESENEVETVNDNIEFEKDILIVKELDSDKIAEAVQETLNDMAELHEKIRESAKQMPELYETVSSTNTQLIENENNEMEGIQNEKLKPKDVENKKLGDAGEVINANDEDLNTDKIAETIELENNIESDQVVVVETDERTLSKPNEDIQDEIEEIVISNKNINENENMDSDVIAIDITSTEQPSVENNDENFRENQDNEVVTNHDDDDNNTEDEEVLAQESLEELLQRKGLQIIDEFAESVTDGDEESEKDLNVSLEKDKRTEVGNELEIKISDAECTEILEISSGSTSKQKEVEIGVAGESQIIQDVDVVEEVVHDDQPHNDVVQEVEVESNGNCLDVANNVVGEVLTEVFSMPVVDVQKSLNLQTEPISDDETDILPKTFENITREIRHSQDMPSLDPICEDMDD